MKKTSLIFTCLILASCVTKKEVTKETDKKDSINTETNKVRIDTIFKDRVIHETEFFTNEILIPCDSAKFSQSIKSGKTSYKIVKEKGQVKVVFKRDSSTSICENQYKVLTIENNSLKSKISSLNQTQTKEVVKKPFFANLWQILFFVILILWILGITPKFIISKFI